MATTEEILNQLLSLPVDTRAHSRKGYSKASSLRMKEIVRCGPPKSKAAWMRTSTAILKPCLEKKFSRDSARSFQGADEIQIPHGCGIRLD